MGAWRFRMIRYSAELKDAMVAKLCMPEGPTIYELSKETGIPRGSLYSWVHSKSRVGKMTSKNRPQDWSPEERLQAVFEAQNLDEQNLGVFLRRNGLHSSVLEEWKNEALASVAVNRKRGRPRKDPELVALEEENKKLKKDLRRKEKALAEQTALVILQKKVHELWGKDEDDE